MISSWLLLSRLPVGSSARRRDGSLASARAIAMRWRWPTESCAGRCVLRSARPTSSISRAARSRALGGRVGALEHRDLDVLECSQSGHQIKRLEDEADLAGAVGVDIELGKRASPEKDVALGRAVEAAQDVQQRALAAAAGAGDRH